MLSSPVDIAIAAAVVLLVFGPKKVPELGRALGQGIGNFKRALTDAQDEVKAGMKMSDEQAAAAAQPQTANQVQTVAQGSASPATAGAAGPSANSAEEVPKSG